MSIDYAAPPSGIESKMSAARDDDQDARSIGGVAALGHLWRRAFPLLRSSLRAHLLFIALSIAYVLAEFYLPTMLGIPTPLEPAFSYKFFASMSGLVLAVPACLYVFHVMIFLRPQRLTAHLASDLQRFVSFERVATAMPVFILFPFFGSAFSYFRI